MTVLQRLYDELEKAIVASGQRVLAHGDKRDIGVRKSDLTAEDIRIERELTSRIHAAFPDHAIYAEEENDTFEAAENLWAIDPISGTSSFIKGMPHYALVVTHLLRGVPKFAAVYDPSVDELFTARAGEGAYLNGRRLAVSGGDKKVILNIAIPKIGTAEARQIWQNAASYDLYRNSSSFAVNYCWVAAGRYDGVIALAKDAFPEFAGSLIVAEAGGHFGTPSGSHVGPADRLFVGGNPIIYQALAKLAFAQLQVLVP